VTCPTDAFHGNPCRRGGQGTGTFYTQDKTSVAKENERLVHLEPGSDVKSWIIGPRNPRANPADDFRSEIRVRRDGSTLRIETGGTPSTLELKEKSWSPWVKVKFKMSMLQSVPGMVRFYVRQLSPMIEFYVSPVNFDPAAPVFPISSPPDYAKKLSEEIGPFATLGMAEDRRHERIPPRFSHTTLKLPNGQEFLARLVDVSISGAALAVAAKPPIGSAVVIGETAAQVVRHFEGGIALEFNRLFPIETFSENITL